MHNRFKHIITSLLVLFLSGCGGNWMKQDCSDVVSVATIQWRVTPDPRTTCELLSGKATLDKGGACIYVVRTGDSNAAMMWANHITEVDDTILGHEIKHAFGCKH